MSAEILLEQALAFVRRSFTSKEVKTCEAYGGQFSAAEIAFKSYSCPAILITVLGWQPPPKDARMGAGRHVKQYRLAAFVLYEHVERTKRMTGAMALAENLGTVLRQWAPMTEPDNAALLATIAGLDYEPKCENMYSRAFDEARQAMFLVSWYQCAMPAVPLGPGRPAVPYSELPDLVAVEINDTVQAGQELDLSPPDNDAAILVEESVDFAFLAAPPPPPAPAPSQTMLLDNFDGSGSAEGRMPDVGYTGVVWHHQELESHPPEATVVAGGKCVATVPNVYVSYSPDVYSDFIESTVTFAFRAEAAFATEGAGCRGYLVFEGLEGQRLNTGFDVLCYASTLYFRSVSQTVGSSISGQDYFPAVALGDVFEFVVRITDGLQEVSVNGTSLLSAALPVDLGGVKPTVRFVIDSQGWSLLNVNAVCDGDADISVPPVGCNSTPEFNSLYWLPPFVAALEEQPVFSGIQPALIDLAPQNLVASGVSHSSGRWCFEIELERIWAYGDREHVDALDITVERSWLYGGVVSCVDLSANLPVYRTIFAANGEGAAEVVSTFADHTGIGDLTGMTYSGPGTVRLGMEVNLSTGDWAFYTMGNVDIASGVSPAIVGIPMLAAVASVTGTPGFYHLQSLYLNAGELWVARSGAMPWNF